MQFKFGDTVRHHDLGYGRVVGKGFVHEDVIPYPGATWAVPTGNLIQIIYVRFADGSYEKFRGNECYNLEHIYVAS